MRVIDLFCGAGGFSTGFVQAGHEIVAAVDNWQDALATHEANHPNADHILADIHDIDGADLPECDVVIGSPPCTEFSCAKGKAADPEKGMELVREYLRLIQEIKPRWYIMENVRGVENYLPSMPHIEVLNSADYGVPQCRYRLFAGRFIHPLPTHAEQPLRTLDGRRLERWRGWGEALGLTKDISGMWDELHDGGRFTRVDRPAPTQDARTGGRPLLVSGMNLKHYKEGRRFGRHPDAPSEAVRGNDVYVAAPTLVGATDFSRAKRGEFNGRAVDKPSPTLKSKDQAYIKRPLTYPANAIQSDGTITATGHHVRAKDDVLRRLTAEECAILQGFPGDYVWKGSKTSQRKQIGNAVPPPMARALAEMLK